MNGRPIALAAVAASVFRLAPILLSALGWRRLMPAARRPRLPVLVLLRWIGEAVNTLLPWAQAAGDVVRARLLSGRGLPAVEATAVMVVDLAAGVFGQLLYTALGLAVGGARGIAATRAQVLALAAATAATLGLVPAGPAITRVLVRAGARRWPALARRLEAFQASLRTLAVDRRALAACCAWHVASWVTQAAETWFVLRIVGGPVSLSGALWLDSLTAAARGVIFFVPAGLGAQEAALLTLGGSLGVAQPALVMLAVVKRARELAVGGLGAAAWALYGRRRRRPVS